MVLIIGQSKMCAKFRTLPKTDKGEIMTPVVLVLVFVFIFIILGFLVFIKNKETTNHQNILENIPVYPKMLLTKDELQFYQTLKTILSSDYDISCKCRLEDIIGIDKRSKNYKSDRNRIKSSHIDFIVFNAITGKVEFVIELDGNSHNIAGQKEADMKKDILLKNAKIKLIRMPSQKKYDPDNIRQTIEYHINN